jgi:hypothetical protein
MKITITINKEQAEHLKSPHMFSDECGTACDILYKVQKEINKNVGTKNPAKKGNRKKRTSA